MAKKTKNLEYYEAIGRRKKAVARVRLYLSIKGKEVAVKGLKIKQGEIIVNGHPIDKTYSSYQKDFIFSPFKLTGSENRFAVSIKSNGGGKNGQMEAIAQGISRALVLADESFRGILKKESLLTRDSRKKERRKVGTGGKARRAKQSPKR